MPIAVAVVVLAALGTWAPAAHATGRNGRIAFVSDRDGVDHIFAMRPDGGDVRRLTDGPLADENSVFSPDGTRIVFSRRISTRNYDLFEMRADGTGVVRLTSTPASDEYQP